MKHYILIHGAWEEASIWNDVTLVLKKAGHSVTAVDLPGHGANEQAIPSITMAGYVRAVAQQIKELDHQVVLVGHSMAGAVISQVAEEIPEKIERLIYVAAFLLNEGDSVLEAMQGDVKGEFYPQLVFSDDQSFATVPEQTLRTVGFHDVEPQVIERVLPALHEKQATEPFLAKASLSNANFGSVPKSFIRTGIDRVTSPDLQDRMIANWKVETVHEIESGHFPAFSVPAELAEQLLAAAIQKESALA